MWGLLWLVLVIPYLIGLVRCFRAHVLLGLAAVFMQGLGVVEWIGLTFFRYDLAQDLARILNLPARKSSSE